MKISRYSDIAIRIQRQLTALANVSVNLVWCPSHIGVVGNELADQLAKRGLEETYSGSPYISLSYLRRKIRESCIDSWKSLWASEEAREDRGSKARGLGNHYRKVMQGGLRFSFKPSLLACPRAIQSAYIQLQFGIG